MLQFLLQKVIPDEVMEGLGTNYPSNDFFHNTIRLKSGFPNQSTTLPLTQYQVHTPPKAA